MSFDYAALSTEFTTDPVTLGYVVSDPVQCHAAITLIRSTEKVDRTVVPSWEVFAALDLPEYGALSVENKEVFRGILSMGEINVQDSNVRALISDMFPSGTHPITRANLIALQQRDASRAEALFGGNPSLNDCRVALGVL